MPLGELGAQTGVSIRLRAGRPPKRLEIFRLRLPLRIRPRVGAECNTW
jgi:hypothetical protein